MLWGNTHFYYLHGKQTLSLKNCFLKSLYYMGLHLFKNHNVKFEINRKILTCIVSMDIGAIHKNGSKDRSTPTFHLLFMINSRNK